MTKVILWLEAGGETASFTDSWGVLMLHKKEPQQAGQKLLQDPQPTGGAVDANPRPFHPGAQASCRADLLRNNASLSKPRGPQKKDFQIKE